MGSRSVKWWRIPRTSVPVGVFLTAVCVVVDTGEPPNRTKAFGWAAESERFAYAKTFSPRRLRQGVTDLTELGVGIGSDGLNRRQTNDDDQSQHHGVFHRSRSIFGNQKPFDALHDVLHSCPLSFACAVRASSRNRHRPKRLSPNTTKRHKSHRCRFELRTQKTKPQQ
jgi:hypothetical protein